MTQAYNLSQLANNLNTSGQLDATDGLVNALPVANGGTGASDAATARSNLSVPSTTGGGASGTWGISISGTASLIADGAVSTTAKISNGVVTPAKLAQPFTAGTAVASTSGTNIDFTGIPSWVQRITILLNGMSTSGIALPLIQVGNGSFVSSGYSYTTVDSTGLSAAGTSGLGFYMAPNWKSTYNGTGTFTISKITGNTWVFAGSMGNNSFSIIDTANGSVALSGVLDRVRFTTTVGNTFTGGTVNIFYE